MWLDKNYTAQGGLQTVLLCGPGWHLISRPPVYTSQVLQVTSVPKHFAPQNILKACFLAVAIAV